MHRLEVGMAVLGVRGRRVGVVREIRDDCFEVTREREDGGPVSLTSEAIFTVDRREGVTLVCDGNDVGRYRCDLHTVAESVRKRGRPKNDPPAERGR